MKKRIIPILLVCFALTVLFAACGESKDPDLYFTNLLDTEIHNVYIASVDAEDWTDPVTAAPVKSGRTIHFDFTKAGEGAGPGMYDFGVIDETGMNYDLYDVNLAVGDKIELSGNEDGAVFTVTHADGSSETHDAWIYPND